MHNIIIIVVGVVIIILSSSRYVIFYERIHTLYRYLPRCVYIRVSYYYYSMIILIFPLYSAGRRTSDAFLARTMRSTII